MRICAGITLFEPDINRLRENVLATIGQVERIYLIDNGSKNIEKIKSEFGGSQKIEIIENNQNFGIATALNQMCNMAIKDGFDYIMTLDQDSVPESDLIEKYSRYLDMDKVALITPRFIDDNEFEESTAIGNEPYSFVERCNTSASLVKLSAFNEVGGFDDKMFIDCVDFDYCTTLLKNGYKILRDNEAILHHRLGEAKEVRFFIPFGKLLGIKKLQKPLYTYNHSPLRTYYYARNIRYYAFKHKDFINLKTEKRVYLKWLVLKLFFEKQKFARLRAIIKGKKDSKKMIKEILN